MKSWVLDNAVWLLALAGMLAVAGLALALLALLASRRQQLKLQTLEVRYGVLQENTQRELLAMGQRVIEAEKTVRRFSDRIEALEAAQPALERYGQLGSLLAGKLGGGDAQTISAAELALKSLLQRGKSD